MLRITVLILSLICISCSPLQSDTWGEKVLADVEKVIAFHEKKTNEIISTFGEQSNSQLNWQVYSTTDQPVERPRPPQLDASIGNLLNIADRLVMENADAISNDEALMSAYLAKKSEIDGKLAVPQQQLLLRYEERQLCEKEEKAMSKLHEVVINGLNREKQISDMRATQSAHYLSMTNTMRALTERNQQILNQIQFMISIEIGNEQKINGSDQFDPIALRQRTPEDILNQSNQLSSDLGNILQEKMENENKALVEISQAFSCPVCDEKSQRLQQISEMIKTIKENKRIECQNLAESHRVVDETDRETSLALKRELSDLENAHSLRDQAEKSLKDQRNQAEHVAKKMVGFYQNLPPVPTQPQQQQ